MEFALQFQKFGTSQYGGNHGAMQVDMMLRSIYNSYI